MKITNTNSSILQTIRQPTKLEEQNSLVFVYPFIIDKFLERKWANDLRDFFTTQFTSQIKISNVLNITSSAANHTINDQQISKLENAAQNAAQSDALGLLTNRQQTQQAPYQQYYNQLAKHEYQDKVNRFREFIKSQVMIDPRFSDVRPMISNITVENLIDIPLILGTKSSGIGSIPLFWILLMATGQTRDDFNKDSLVNPETGISESFTKSLRLDRQQSFEYIGRYVKQVTGAKYINYAPFLDRLLPIPEKTGPSNRISATIHGIDSDIDKALKVFMRATNERMFSDEIGFSQNSKISISNAYLDTMDSQSSTKMKAQNLFTSFLANYVIPVTQSVTHTVIGVNEVDINAGLHDLSSDLMSQFMGIYDMLDSEFKRTLMAELDETSDESSLVQLNRMEKMCEANAQLAVVPILQQFKNISFKLTSTRADIVNFIESLSRIAAQLDTYSSGLMANLLSMSSDSTKVKRELDKFIGTSIRDLFFRFFTESKSGQNGAIIGTQPLINSVQGQAPIFNSSRLSQFLGNHNTETYLNQISSALNSISVFMAYYVFFSYLCENMGELKAKVEVQKKDALDFPNYCLVFRKEVVEALYGALAAASYKTKADIESYEKQHKNDNSGSIANKINTDIKGIKRRFGINTPEPQKPVDSLTNFKINETDIMQMMRILNNRLNIPNLIVVDDKTDTVYYKWMYSGGSIGKLTLSAIQTYNQHQQEILPGY